MSASIHDAAQELRDHYVQLDHAERELLGRLIDSGSLYSLPVADRRILVELRDRLRPQARPAVRDLTREQELAADRIASEYGRSAVRHQADGSIVVTALLDDDIEMRTVCLERDGRERWRR